MTKKFAELRARMSPQAQERAGLKAKAMLAEMPLHELRQARGLTQKVLADTLRVEQPSIAKMERRTDVYVSTLRSLIEAMGGTLEVTARFPDGNVKITNFSGIAGDSEAPNQTASAATIPDKTGYMAAVSKVRAAFPSPSPFGRTMTEFKVKPLSLDAQMGVHIISNHGHASISDDGIAAALRAAHIGTHYAMRVPNPVFMNPARFGTLVLSPDALQPAEQPKNDGNIQMDHLPEWTILRY